jgi:hypothetical protein
MYVAMIDPRPSLGAQNSRIHLGHELGSRSGRAEACQATMSFPQHQRQSDANYQVRLVRFKASVFSSNKAAQGPVPSCQASNLYI